MLCNHLNELDQCFSALCSPYPVSQSGLSSTCNWFQIYLHETSFSTNTTCHTPLGFGAGCLSRGSSHPGFGKLAGVFKESTLSLGGMLWTQSLIKGGNKCFHVSAS